MVCYYRHLLSLFCIILFAAIGALQILQISAISDPATNMLNGIALAIPNVLAALVWLALSLLTWSTDLVVCTDGRRPMARARACSRSFRPRVSWPTRRSRSWSMT